MVTQYLEQETEVLLAAMREAGAAIHDLQQAQLEIKKKANNDIVTAADLRANDILKQKLLSAFPADGWLSEETVDDAKRLTCQRVWIVDPIDGTREYAAGIPEYAVSVALVDKGAPVLASVFNPATDELFYAIKGQGAWLNDAVIPAKPSRGSDPLDGSVIPAKAGIHPQSKLLLLASRSEYMRGEWSRFEKNCEVLPVGSIAYKLALLAAGRAHATFSLGPKSEWDIAAGVLLVQEAGGIVTNQLRQTLVFNNKNVRVNGVVATTRWANKEVFDLLSPC